jgi:hypothetical protein
MRLDMFLEKETSFFQNKIELKIDGEEIESSRITKITESVGYWRQFYDMHKWIVKNVQNGEDDCGRYWIDEETMLELCEFLSTLKGKNKFDDDEINSTIELLTSLIGDNNITEFSAFYYNSSW